MKLKLNFSLSGLVSSLPLGRVDNEKKCLDQLGCVINDCNTL